MWNKSIPLRLKRWVHNECIFPVIMYGSETWSLSKAQLHKMVTTQCKMEWIMMGLTLLDRKSASWIHSKTGTTDIIHQIHANKHWCAGHVSWLGWKTTAGPKAWESGAHKTTSGPGVIQKDVDGTTSMML